MGGSCALAERKASRWRKEPRVEAIEILEAQQVVMPFLKDADIAPFG
jgi:hypothetical protein